MKAGNKHSVFLFLFLLLGSLVVVFFSGCDDEQPEDGAMAISTDSIIPEPTMILMLADAHMIEAAMLIHRNRGLSVNDSARWYYKELYHKYGVTAGQYNQSIRFYQKDPKYFADMYQQVINLLARKEKDFVKK